MPGTLVGWDEVLGTELSSQRTAGILGSVSTVEDVVGIHLGTSEVSEGGAAGARAEILLMDRHFQPLHMHFLSREIWQSPTQDSFLPRPLEGLVFVSAWPFRLKVHLF